VVLGLALAAWADLYGTERDWMGGEAPSGSLDDDDDDDDCGVFPTGQA